MTGVRIGIILQALSAAVTALVIAFASGWKLTFVVLCFTPLILLLGKIQSQNQGKVGQAKDKDSFSELGGQVNEHRYVYIGLRNCDADWFRKENFL